MWSATVFCFLAGVAGVRIIARKGNTISRRHLGNLGDTPPGIARRVAAVREDEGWIPNPKPWPSPMSILTSQRAIPAHRLSNDRQVNVGRDRVDTFYPQSLARDRAPLQTHRPLFGAR